MSILLEGVEIAAINTSNLIVVAGKEEAISKQQALLEQEGVECRKLATSHGFHTAMIEPALEKLQYEIENTQTNMPQISYVSNLTGTWIDNKVQDVKYWLDHARNTVRFAQSSKFLLEKFADAIILEVGPGRTMTSLMRKSEAWSQKHKAVLFLDNKGNENELKQFYSGLMELWVSGVNINWNNYYKDKKMKRVPLPTYCFKKEVHILETKYQQEAENISPVEVAKQELEVLKNQTKGVYIKEGQLLAAKDNLLVYDIGCVAGSQITNNTQVLAKCVEVNNLIVTLNIPTEDLGKIAMGSEVKLDVYTNQDKSIKGKISRISNHAEIIDGDSYIKADVTVDEGIELLKLDEKLDASIEIN